MNSIPRILPADLINPVLEQLTDSSDLSRCARVNQTFHAVAVPLLYRSLEVRFLVVVSSDTSVSATWYSPVFDGRSNVRMMRLYSSIRAQLYSRNRSMPNTYGIGANVVRH